MYRNPSLIVGTLFGSVNIGPSESNTDIGTGSTIGLLLGVTDKDVKSEHRAALLTFPQWTLMDIVEEEPTEVDGIQSAEMVDDDSSFSRRLFKASMRILKLDNQRRREKHYSVPSTIHIPSNPPSPTQGSSATGQFCNGGASSSKFNCPLEPTFHIWPNECDTVCINALQKSVLLLLSHSICSSKDKIECYFVCIEKKNRKMRCDVTTRSGDSGGSVTSVAPISLNQENELSSKNIFGCEISTKGPVMGKEDIFSMCSITSLPNDNMSLPPKNKIRNDEIRKTVIRLESKCISSNMVETMVSSKDFSRLSKFLSVRGSEESNLSENVVVLELKVNGVSWNCGKIVGNEDAKNVKTKGQLVNLETPMSTLERLMDTSTLLTESTLNCVNGNDSAMSLSLDQNLASIISQKMPNDLFSWCLDLQSTESSTKTDNFTSMYPTLIHWAAYKGLDKVIIALLSLPGSTLAAQQLNCDRRSASEMAKVNNP